ncbi:MAG: hypothetical protein AB7E47_05970 [Desulfovibrionaceae bacterium]
MAGRGLLAAWVLLPRYLEQQLPELAAFLEAQGCEDGDDLAQRLVRTFTPSHLTGNEEGHVDNGGLKKTLAEAVAVLSGGLDDEARSLVHQAVLVLEARAGELMQLGLSRRWLAYMFLLGAQYNDQRHGQPRCDQVQAAIGLLRGCLSAGQVKQAAEDAEEVADLADDLVAGGLSQRSAVAALVQVAEAVLVA